MVWMSDRLKRGRETKRERERALWKRAYVRIRGAPSCMVYNVAYIH